MSDKTTVTSPAIHVGKLSTGATVGLSSTDVPSHYHTKKEYKYKSKQKMKTNDITLKCAHLLGLSCVNRILKKAKYKPVLS